MIKALSFVVLFLATTLCLQAQSDKTLVKTLNTEEATSLVVDIKSSEINPQIWDGGSFRLELTIKANMPIQVLEQLVKVGRYNIKGYKEDGKYYVTTPNMSKNVSVRGKDLEEEVVVKVMTPGYYVLTDNALSKNDEVIAGRTLDEEALNEFYKIKQDIELPEVSLKSSLNSKVNITLKTGDILIDGEPLELD